MTSRLWRLCGAAGGVCVMSAALLPPAAAWPIRDEDLGLVLDPGAGGVPVCTIDPPGSPDDPACAGVDFLKARQSLSSSSGARRRLGTALLRPAEGAVVMSASMLPIGVSLKAVSIDETMRMLESGMPRVSPGAHLVEVAPGKRYEITQVNGLDALHYEVDLDWPVGDSRRAVGHWLVYIVPGDSGDVQIAWMHAPEMVGPARGLAAKVMGSIQLRATQQGDLGRGAAYHAGQAIYHFMMAALPLGLLGAAVAWVIRARRRGPPETHDAP